MKIKKHLSFTGLRTKLSEEFNKIIDKRQESKVKISIHDAMMSGFAAMYFQDPSLLQFQIRMQEDQHRNNLETLFEVEKIPKETQMREIIDDVDSDSFSPIFKDFYLRLQRGKHLEQFQIFPNLYYFPIDGSQFYSSNDVHCDQCLVKEHKKYTRTLVGLKGEPNPNGKSRGYYLYRKLNDETVYVLVVHTKDCHETLNLSERLKHSEIEDRLALDWPENSEKVLSLETELVEIIRANCKHSQHVEASLTYSHQVLQGGIMHPDCSQVIPFMPEQIVNSDGATKQDCEMNGAKRFVKKLRQQFPQLGLIIGGDALFSKQPIIEDVVSQRMHYLFVAKPSDHKVMMEMLDELGELNKFEFLDEKGNKHCYEWRNNVPLTGQRDTVFVNFLRCEITGKNKKGEEAILHRNSWVTDINISEENIAILVKAGRCRWKNENEVFNVMKNHGYYMERNYGHGKKNLAFNFYLLTLLAFLFHQIFELTDRQYKACRKKFGSKRHLWEKLRAYIDIIIFETWEKLLEFALTPKKGLLQWAVPP